MFPHSRKYGTYLFKDQSGIYYFRIIVPAFLRDIYPNIQKEYRRSLATANKRVAKALSISLYFEVMEKFNITVRNAETFDQVIRHIPAYLYLNSDLPDSIKMELKGVYGQILKANKALLENHYLEDITKGQSDLLKLIESNMDVIVEACEYDNKEFVIIDALLKGLEQNTSKLIRRIERDKTHSSSFMQAKDNSPAFPATTKVKGQNAWDDVYEAFIDETLSTEIITEKTSNAYLASFELFRRITKVSFIQEIDQVVARKFRNDVQKVPARLNSTPKIRALPLSQLFQMDLPRISKETVNKHINRLSRLLKWSIDLGYIDTNYMEGKELKIKKKKESEKILPFSIQELNSIFSTKIHQNNNFEHPYYFWLPLISLYSGARIQEICQLELADITTIDGILVFDINANSDLKRLKNEFSERKIPVHPKLIELGLEKEINRLKRLKRQYLFKELHKDTGNRDGQSTSASKWFGRFKKKMNFDNEDKKVFHSFRHTFLDQARKLDIKEHIASGLAGQHHSQITYGTYGGKLDVVKELYPAIFKIEYDGLDLKNVKWKAN